MDFWVSERCQVWTSQASLHEKTLIYSAFSVFNLGYYWLRGAVSAADRGIVLCRLSLFYNPSVTASRATSLYTREAWF